MILPNKGECLKTAAMVSLCYHMIYIGKICFEMGRFYGEIQYPAFGAKSCAASGRRRTERRD